MDAAKMVLIKCCEPTAAKPGYMRVTFILDCIYLNSHLGSTQPTVDFKISSA